MRAVLDQLPRWRVVCAALLALAGLGGSVVAAQWARYSISCPAEVKTAWVLLAGFLAMAVAAALLDVRASAGRVAGGVALMLLVLGVMAANACDYPGHARLAFDRVQGALPEEELGPAGRHKYGIGYQPRQIKTFDHVVTIVESSLKEAGMHPERCGSSTGTPIGPTPTRRVGYCLQHDFDVRPPVVVEVEEVPMVVGGPPGADIQSRTVSTAKVTVSGGPPYTDSDYD
jgi:hypothetical protein